MKTKYLFFAAMAATTLASCSSNDFVGDEVANTSPTGSAADGSIKFGGGFKAITRGLHEGADAANKLNNKFIVGGFKGAATAASTTVFDNYQVTWTANTAGTTESNTSDWEYVGVPKYLTSNITTAQTIKYWDYSVALYDFVAYSTGTKDPVTSDASGKITVTAFNPSDHSFTLKGAEADLIECYVADRVTVEKANFGKEVTLSFRNLAAKVRVALFETIPGYSVKNVYFYQDDATTGIDADISTKTSATLIGTFNTGGTYTVTYPGTTKGESDYNKAHVTLTGATTATYRNTFGGLNYVAGDGALSSASDYLARTSTAPSFAGSGTYYQTVLPNEVGAVMELRINYTLEANDGSGELITIRGAKAFIPEQFTKWLPNYAYTYIFKISDNTNGWASTTDTDPAGLYPITFDAVVVDSEDNTQSTITTVATPSITTYQKGHKYTDGPEYKAGDIYVQVMNGSTLADDLDSKGQLYSLSGNKTEAEVLDALHIRATDVAAGYTLTGRNDLSMASETSDASITNIPGEDGNNITVNAGEAAKFTAVGPKVYAYVYSTGTWKGIKHVLTATPTDWDASDNVYYSDEACTIKVNSAYTDGTYYKKESYIYTAETQGSSEPTGWATNYFKDPNGKEPVEAWVPANNGQIFYKKYAVDGQIYGVKVINVVAAL